MSEAFERLRPRLFGVAYGIVGSVADAEDVLQDAWVAWSGFDRATVRSVDAYLVRLVAHRALNSLRAQQRRRETYVGPWLPEPVETAQGPEDAAALADSVTFALLVLLEQLSPLERAAFVLREVFEVPAPEVGRTLGRSPAAVRQLVSRARAHLSRAGGEARYDVDAALHHRLAGDFVTAMRSGDITTVLTLIAPEVTLVTDGGGTVQAALRPVVGRDNVLRFFQGLATRYPGWSAEHTELNGLPALVVHAGDTVSAVHFGVRDGVVTDIWVVRNPAKLTGVTPRGKAGRGILRP